MSDKFAGVYSSGATPDPIPNSEVKSACGDGIAQATVWESSTTPAFFSKRPIERSVFFLPKMQFCYFLTGPVDCKARGPFGSQSRKSC